MDAGKYKALADAIELLTMSGEPKLDEKKLKEVKKICRISDEYICHCFDLIWSQLKREHSEIRLSSFQIVDELFRRSHKFRTLLLDNFQTYLELTLEIDQLDNPLPPPAKAAETLKNSAYAALRNWHETYSSGYRKLQLAYNYLRNCHQVDFNKAEHVSAVERQRKQEAQLQLQIQRNKRIEKVEMEITEHKADITGFTHQLSTCFRLLLPSQDVFDAFDDQLFEKDPISVDTSVDKAKEESTDQTASSSVTVHETDLEMQEHGLLTRRNNVNINLADNSTIVESEDNTDIIHNLDEMKVLLTIKYLPMTIKWLQVLQKNGAQQNLITEVIDIKQGIQKSLNNLDVLKIERRVDEDSDDDDGDMIEVAENIDEVTFLKSRLGMTGKPTNPDDQPSTSKGRRHNAPVLEYDLDLEYWENPKELKVPDAMPNDSARFWVSTDRDITYHSSVQELYSSRKIDFSGTFVPVKWTCRAALPNGRLCPRMDRVKCPFHGPIIARNDDGSPASPCDADKLEKIKEKQRQEHPEWQDPAFLNDLQSQTGVNLQVKKKTAASKQKSKLTNISKPRKTARNRLESKVLSRKAMKRVAGALNNLDHKRLKDKFCHSFNATFAK